MRLIIQRPFNTPNLLEHFVVSEESEGVLSWRRGGLATSCRGGGGLTAGCGGGCRGGGGIPIIGGGTGGALSE